jgi:hypothetical protein
MIDARCSRKNFLAFGVCTLASGLAGCGAEPLPSTRAEGGSSAGGGAAGGSSGASGSGGSGAPAGTGSGGASSGGSSGASGSGGVSGSSGASGSGGVSGSGGASGGGGVSSGPNGGSGGAFDVCNTDIVASCSPEVSDGHTHTLVVTADVINAGEDIVLLTAEDTSGHRHEVELTSTDFLILKDGGLVVKDECGQGPHQFVMRCPTPPPAIVPECLWPARCLRASSTCSASPLCRP